MRIELGKSLYYLRNGKCSPAGEPFLTDVEGRNYMDDTKKKVSAKPVAKAVAAKTAETKTAEVKAAVVSAAEVKKEEPVKAVIKEEPKKAAVKEEPKKAAEKKPVEKKTAEKKPAEKKTAAKKAEEKAPAKKTEEKKAAEKKTAVKETVQIEFAGKAYTTEDLMRIAKDVWKYDLNQKEADFKKAELYVKPEESKVYYVINDTVTGDFAI